MRTLSSAVATLLSRDSISYFYLVDIGNGQLRHCSLARDITVGGITYSGNNTLLAVDPPRLSPVVDRESYKVTYLDSDFSYKPLFEAGFFGQPFIVKMGFFNTTQATLNGVAPGDPLLSTNDILTIYQGLVDSQAYSINMQERATLVIEGTSPMGALDQIRSLLTSKDWMNQVNTSDTSLDQMFIGSASIELLWGKKEK